MWLASYVVCAGRAAGATEMVLGRTALSGSGWVLLTVASLTLVDLAEVPAHKLG